MAMRLWSRFVSFFAGSHSPCARCNVYVRLTGEPPCSLSEHLIVRLAGERRTASFHWLEGQISEALYQEELHRGGAVLDIGVGGPALYRQEAARLLAGTRRDFGQLVKASDGGC